ncbi:MAG: ImmA/IrrE family metallo-endopeptidase [Chloroflexi bacterium]|nr:ImmA/IrrE family metallo-endopeptidase [Chloroflexota bacterium]
MAIERMPITPEVITWARERLGYTLDALIAKRSDFKRVAEWESGESRPTYRQLEKLAKELWLPVAVFFFPEPPESPKIEETFHTLSSAQFAEIPPRIRTLLHKARAFQSGLAELNDGRNPARRIITRDLRISSGDSLTLTARQIREYLGVSSAEQCSWPNVGAAFEAWRKAFYDVGVTVFKDAFGVDDFCGFSLYDVEFPVIYANNSNAKTRQIFTLFHELAHLLYRTSGIDRQGSFENKLPSEHEHIEQQCNALANAVLVPEEEFNLARTPGRFDRSEADSLAKRFSVSREVIYRRFLDRNWIETGEYEAAAAEWARQFKLSQKGKTGGDHYRTRLVYLGEEYVALAFRRYYEERIDDEELADYLGIKPKHIDLLEETWLGER